MCMYYMYIEVQSIRIKYIDFNQKSDLSVSFYRLKVKL